MSRHASGSVLCRRWAVMAAGLLTTVLAITDPAAATEIAPRRVAFRVPGNIPAWGPFTFGMTPDEVDRAALRTGGRVVSVGGASVAGQPFAYHGPDQIKGGRHSRGEPALLWFDGGRLSQVTVTLFRLSLPNAEACLRAHRTAAANILPGRGAPEGAATVRDTRRGSDGPGQPADETDGVVWTTGAQQSRLRATIETTWEAPVSAMQAGTDETCIGMMTLLPNS